MSLPPFTDPDALGQRPTDGDAAIEGASAAVRAWAGWHIWPSLSETVTVNGSGAVIQLLPTLYLTEVESVTENAAAVTDFTWSSAGYLERPCRWTRKLRGIVVEMTHGYDDADLPLDLVSVVMDAASASLASASRPGATQESAGPFSVSYQTATEALAYLGSGPISRFRIPPAA